MITLTVMNLVRLACRFESVQNKNIFHEDDCCKKTFWWGKTSWKYIKNRHTNTSTQTHEHLENERYWHWKIVIVESSLKYIQAILYPRYTCFDWQVEKRER